MNLTEVSRPSVRLNLTKDLKFHNAYTIALENEFHDFAFSEERAPHNKGRWREQVFQAPSIAAMDLEIGTGNGLHFSHRVLSEPNRCYIGVEMKYKPLIQTIRRVRRVGAKNGAVARYHAMQLEDLFSAKEVNDIYIHFPDPWTSPRKPKNRIVQKANLDLFWELQRPGSKIEFKTDSAEAFKWCLDEIHLSKYRVELVTHDLHQSEEKDRNFVTAFERIFLRQGLNIHFVRLWK